MGVGGVQVAEDDANRREEYLFEDINIFSYLRSAYYKHAF